MLTDWFTIAAQIVNFLVLVWLLKHFLYGRIVAAINKRETKIAACLAETEVKEKAATEQLALYQAKLADFEQQREGMLNEARLHAAELRAGLIENARARAQELETKWRDDLERERDAFLVDLRSRAAAEILAIVRRTVADLTCTDVQQCAVRTFLAKLRGLDHDAFKSLGSGELLIRSASELPEDTRAEIRRRIQEELEAPVRLRFEHAPDLGLGVELRGNGRRIAWNSENYLEALERDLKEAFEHSHAGAL